MNHVQVIELHPAEAECRICDCVVFIRQSGPSFGLPLYESDILPDDDPGEWGGVTVCMRCYYMVRGYQADHPGRVAVCDMQKLAGAK